MPAKLLIEIEYPGGIVSYEAPVLKKKDYSIRGLFDKKLLLLLPFYEFKFEGEFEEIDRSRDYLEKVSK